ncbi:MAG: type II secretion system protein [Holophagales bacterium]|nr:type II secretion system protein [Holophagales bacterium]MYG31559.1 type II secretion system protein [Holophagales bacterium]MYI78371.1 type II secretion system protein [Holophagales bacterium]
MNRTRLAGFTAPRHAGFTLVEVLVSFALLGLTAATVLALLVRSGLNNLEARRAEALAAMARVSLPDLDGAEDLEQVWCPSAAAWQAACAAESPRYRRVVRSVPVAEPGRPGESLEVAEVTLHVTALQAGRAAGERTITVVTLRVP